MSYIGSYVWKLRQKVGHDRIIMAGVGLIVTNAQGHIWMGKRSDDGTWSYFGGAIELGDTIRSTATKELAEEAGLHVPEDAWELVAMHSDPAETNYTYPNGDACQIINHLLRSPLTFESITLADDEHTQVQAFPLTALPANMKPDSAHALKLYQKFLATGQVQVK